jgi:hypothetical protein
MTTEWAHQVANYLLVYELEAAILLRDSIIGTATAPAPAEQGTPIPIGDGILGDRQGGLIRLIRPYPEALEALVLNECLVLWSSWGHVTEVTITIWGRLVARELTKIVLSAMPPTELARPGRWQIAGDILLAAQPAMRKITP